MAKPDNTQLNLSLSSQTNTGTAGGTMYYINLGGLKIVFGTTGSLTSTTGNNYTVVFPSTFFTATPYLAMATLQNMTSTAAQMAGINASNSLSTTQATITVANVPNSSFTGQNYSFLFIGV